MKVYSQLIGAALENKSADYATSVIGRFWWHTTLQQIRFSDGSIITNVLTNNQKCIIGTSGTAASNTRLNRSAAGLLQIVLGNDTTAEGTLSTNLAQLSSRNENYADAGKPAFGNAGRVIWVTDLSILKVDTGGAWISIPTSAAADRLGEIYDAVIGTAGQVASGIATHSTFAAAIAALSAGDSIFVLDGTYTENVSVSKKLTIEGSGHSSNINGTLTFTSSSDNSLVMGVRVADNITFDSGADQIFLINSFLATAKTVTDNGTANYIEMIQE